MARTYTTLNGAQLQQTMRAGEPENDAREEGYALVNVLDSAQFEEEHIPGSMNIPQEDIDEFERRFDKEKKIVVYCASEECQASNETAKDLVERGFEHVFDYEGGLRDWKEAGNPVDAGSG